MIPKIIHYCWLSKDPFPESIKYCIDSWKKFLPDYELMLWNFDRFPKGKSKWVDEAFAAKKFAFAADYIRLYALYNYGGIYLDSDVEILKSFDDLLELPYFIGHENTPSGIETATIGCEKGLSLIKLMLDRYEKRSFYREDGHIDDTTFPSIFREVIEKNYTVNEIRSIHEFRKGEECINLFPVDWFSPKTWDTRELKVTCNTYSIHHFERSWMKSSKTSAISNDVSNPLISIVIPVYKVEEFMDECITSVINQTYKNIEVIVVDDASPNDIKSVVDTFDDPRLRYYRNEKNCGAVRVVDNWNICLGYCTGDYVICIGDDNRLTPECLEEYLRVMEKYPGLAVYHGHTDVIDEHGNVKGHQRKRPEFQSSVELVLHRWNGDIPFIGDFCYDVKQLREDGGYYFMPLAWGSDDITAVRAADHKGIANTQTSCFLYRENGDSITSSKTNGIKL